MKGPKVKSLANKHLGLGAGFYLGAVALSGFNYFGEGMPLGTSIARGLGESLLWEAAPIPMAAYYAATGIPQLGLAIAEKSEANRKWWNQQFYANFGGNYQDTQANLTMRQAAVQAIAGSKLNARSAIGGEARLMHRAYAPPTGTNYTTNYPTQYI